MGRIQSVELFRVIAMFAVVMIHTQPFIYASNSHNEVGIFINQLSRFAVPLFFIISGYFFSKKVNRGNAPLTVASHMSKRILYIFVIWSCIYLLPYNLASIYEDGLTAPLKLIYWKLNRIVENPSQLLFSGTKEHLWFLPALIMCALITGVLLHFRQSKLLIIIAITLFLIGIFSKSYQGYELIDFNFNTRNGPFFGLIFFVSGYWLAHVKHSTSWLWLGGSVFIAGTLLHLFEVVYLHQLFGSTLLADFVFGTYFMGLGAALIAFSNHAYLQKNEKVAELGKCTLGIYLIHFLFVDNLRVIDKYIDFPLWEIGYPLLVFFASLYMVKLLSKNQFTQKILM